MTILSFDLRGVPRTLLLTLRARAAEHQRANGLFRDPTAAAWDARMPRHADLDAWYSQPFEAANSVRARLFDDAARDFLVDNPNGVIVELGAGLSTRRHRLGAPRWISIDLPEAIEVLAQLDPPSSAHQLLAYDLADHIWMGALPFDLPLLIIAEGVLPFLAPQQVTDLLAGMQRELSGATFFFDTLRSHHLAPMNEQFTPLGAPLQWGTSEEGLLELGANQISYLYLAYPERWRQVSELSDDARTAEQSSLMVRMNL